ncbi:protein of unknown function [Latilactobacillus sakei]|nr:protein of unknown function [Latilactobacillus sakei]
MWICTTQSEFLFFSNRVSLVPVEILTRLELYLFRHCDTTMWLRLPATTSVTDTRAHVPSLSGYQTALINTSSLPYLYPSRDSNPIRDRRCTSALLYH